MNLNYLYCFIEMNEGEKKKILRDVFIPEEKRGKRANIV